jgi:hypothetical protein
MTEQTPAPPANATEASAALNLKIADRAWGERLLNGDTAARREYDDLIGRVVTGGDDVVASVMNGTAPKSDHAAALTGIREMSAVVDMFRDMGIKEEITANFLRGDRVTPDEYKAVANWKRAALKDPVFTKAYLAGEQEPRQKMTIANSVLVNGVKEAGA